MACWIGRMGSKPDSSSEPHTSEPAQEKSGPSESTSSWASRLQESQPVNAGISAFSRFTRGFGSQKQDKDDEGHVSAASQQFASLELFTKGLVDSSRNAVKAVQVKARHMVSQNKRRYQVILCFYLNALVRLSVISSKECTWFHLQDGDFDLDMTYITDNIIAMGFPAGSLTSGFFGYLEVKKV